MLTEKEKLRTLARLGMNLNQVQDLDILMEKILTEARRFVNADAGSVYILEGEELHFSYTQNDTLQKRLARGEKLIYSTFTIPIDEKSIAGHVALTGKPLNISDVYKIDPTLPYGFSSKFDKASNYRTCSMLTVPLKNMRQRIIGVLQVINAKDESGNLTPFSGEDENMMLLFASIAAVALEQAKMTRATVLRMIRIAEMRDRKETGMHVLRVGGYAREIYAKWSEKHEIPHEKVIINNDILSIAAMLHDVGKVGIPDKILQKPGKFTKEEYEEMKKHTWLGARLFLNEDSEYDRAAMDVALNHHEKWDGTGYPGWVNPKDGLPLKEYALPDGSARKKKKEEIPLFGRIVALADVFDALLSKRVYKEAFTEDEVKKAICEGKGSHFDPELTDIVLDIWPRLLNIHARYKENN